MLVAGYCNLILDQSGEVLKLVCSHTNWKIEEVGPNICLGFIMDDKLVGGIIYHNLRESTDVWLTIYASDKRWCSRKSLDHIFDIAFKIMKVRRVSLLVDADNIVCLKLVKGLGFIEEGLLRKYRDDGNDCYFFGMLKSDCKWGHR